MEFEFDGKTYELEFERKHKNIEIIHRDKKSGKVTAKKVKSKYPYTTARLIQRLVGVEPKLLVTAIVGCFPTDVFSYKAGREAALKNLSWKLKTHAKGTKNEEVINKTRQLNGVIWETYLNRKNLPNRIKPVVTTLVANVGNVHVTTIPKLLPANAVSN